jgi:hypothetical protein
MKNEKERPVSLVEVYKDAANYFVLIQTENKDFEGVKINLPGWILDDDQCQEYLGIHLLNLPPVIANGARVEVIFKTEKKYF